MTRSPRPILLAAALLAACVALAGCGRKNEPEVPKVSTEAPKADTSPIGMPYGAGPGKPKTEPPNKPFLLDFLM